MILGQHFRKNLQRMGTRQYVEPSPGSWCLFFLAKRYPDAGFLTNRWRNYLRHVLVVFIAITTTLTLWAQDNGTNPVLSDKPLTTEQIGVYQAFLKSYDNGSESPLNVGNVTHPLDASELRDNSACLKGIYLQKAGPAQNTIHHTDPLQTPNLHIVDPAAQQEKIRGNDPSNHLRQGTKTVDDAVKDAFGSGLLTLSEIAFSKNHQWAVMSFGFRCGMLCGHGSVIVLHKVRGQWRPTRRQCGGWVS
jgi:hypothetical protein